MKNLYSALSSLVLLFAAQTATADTATQNRYCVNVGNSDYVVTLQISGGKTVATFMNIDHGNADTKILSPEQYSYDVGRGILLYAGQTYDCGSAGKNQQARLVEDSNTQVVVNPTQLTLAISGAAAATIYNEIKAQEIAEDPEYYTFSKTIPGLTCTKHLSSGYDCIVIADKTKGVLP